MKSDGKLVLEAAASEMPTIGKANVWCALETAVSALTGGQAGNVPTPTELRAAAEIAEIMEFFNTST